jgi:hypothetical protein
MFWDDALIWLVLIAASYFVWKKHNDQLFRWAFWVGVIALGASTWQYFIEHVLIAPEAVQMGSLIAVQALRSIFIGALSLVIVRLFRSTPLTSATENVIIFLPAGGYICYLLIHLFVA